MRRYRFRFLFRLFKLFENRTLTLSYYTRVSLRNDPLRKKDTSIAKHYYIFHRNFSHVLLLIFHNT